MEILKQFYNIVPVTIEELDGDINYSNRKYLVSDSLGEKYIFKIYSDPDEIRLAKEECRILSEISNKLTIRLPETIPNLDGELLTKTNEGACRLSAYIEGDFLANVEQSEKLINDLGQSIGLLHKSLCNIQSDIYSSRKIFWDLQYSQFSYSKSQYIGRAQDRKLVNYFFDRFHNSVLPELHKLRISLIHGDLNDYNILVSDNRISGFIDFGDASVSNLINELAIASAYIMLDKDDPFEALLPLIEGFHKQVPLKNEEVLILPDLITTRLCVSLCNSAEKRASSKASEYVLVSEKPAWDLLRKWIEFNPLSFTEKLLKATGHKSTIDKNGLTSALKKRNKSIGKSLSLSYSSPIYLKNSLFQYMYDKSGNAYLDAYNNIPHIGHSHPDVYRAISKQAQKLNTNTRYLYDSLGSYSEKLLGYFPEKLNRIFYVNSGSAASDLAIRLAKVYTGMNHLLVMDHGYHGNTTTGITISPYKFDGKGGSGLPEGITKLPLPNLYKGKYKSGLEYAVEAISEINKLSTEGIIPAAFIAEPISGCGGQVPIADNYLQEIYSFFKDKPTVMISDEVQVGFGRLGEWFWGYEMHNVVPDIVILGKPMGNGHPIGAVVTTDKIADAFNNGMEFFSSFGGNPVSCEAANAVLGAIEQEELQKNASIAGNYYLESARQLMSQYEVIGDIRGSGLFVGIEFINKDGSPGTTIASEVKNRLRENYILTGTDGPFDNVLKSKPPLCFTKSNVDLVIESLDKILRER